jgi:CubicO group peptidase (beta-lactamase class C family)
MSDFDTLLANYTEKGNAKVHGVLAKCVDRSGKQIYNKISGHISIEQDAEILTDNAVLKVASATKLITTIALLQCVDKGLIGLDEPITKILPELENQKILIGVSDNGALISKPSTTKITARHLISHTSGLAYRFLHPLLIKWCKTAEGEKTVNSGTLAERHIIPLVFEPGQGWAYGVGLDWAGVAVRRLHDGLSLEDYMIENIWKKVGLSAPYPTFHISGHPEYKQRLFQAAGRKPDGSLGPFEFWQGDNATDQDGGHGLSTTANDWLAVLADLIADSPKLLKPATISLMFESQITKDAQGLTMLHQLRPAWEIVAGPISDDAVNHGLGGILYDSQEIGQPNEILGWGGASNIIWFISKATGYAGVFATQLSPFGDPAVKELVNAWKKDFWLQAKF